jgi:hypothetical protein
MRLQSIEPVFVEFVPEKLAPGKLYISLEYNTASHLCACGCGFEVVTILGPADSTLTTIKRGVSISTSIGNSNFPCKSHYWIENNQILWASKMTPRLTALSRAKDKAAKARLYCDAPGAESPSPPGKAAPAPASPNKRKPWWQRLIG